MENAPLSPREIQKILDKNLPPPASLFRRFCAFFADALLAYFLIFAFLKIATWQFWSVEFAEFSALFEKFSAEYQRQILSGNPAAAFASLKQNSLALSENESTQKLFSNIATSSFLIAFFYFWAVEFFTKGATLGKRIFRIRTISQNGNPPNFWQCISRAIWKACSIAPWGIILTIAVLINAHIPIFSYRKRAWHDMLSRTDVVPENAVPATKAR